MFKNQTFKVRLLQVFISLVLILGTVVTVLFYSQTTNIVVDLSERISNEVVGKVREKTDAFLYTPASFTRIASSIVDYDKLVENHQSLWKFMWQPILMTEQLESYFIADRKGNYVQVRRSPVYETRLINRNINPPEEFRIQRSENYEIILENKKVPTFDPRTRTWYVNTGIKNQYYWTDAYVATTSQKPVIGCAYPVLTEEGDKGAVVCVNIPIENLSSFLKEQDISENSILLILDKNEQIIAYQDFEEILIEETILDDEGNEKIIKRIKKLEDLNLTYLTNAFAQYKKNGQKEFIYKHEGEKYFFKVSDISSEIGVNWKIVSVIPERDLLAGVFKIIRTVIIVIACVFLLSIFVIIYISGRITAPLEELALLNEKIKNFDLNITKKITSSISEINNMSISLFNAIKGLRAFQKYVPADLVRQLIATGQEVEVGGVPKRLTILFTDIEGFTSISEKMSSDFLMQHLSEYFDELSTIIMDQKGTIDKYIGDSIMAFWGAPVEHEDSTFKACSAALLCQKKLVTLNENWRNYNKPVMNTRIGIATGRVVVGNVGSSNRINYSVIGDDVNLSSRLEGTNKVYGTKIIIDEYTYLEIKDHFICRFLDIVAVSGKEKGTRIYELVAEKNDYLDSDTKKFIQIFEKGLNAYLKQDWTNALRYFLYIRKNIRKEDESVNLFIKRCSFFRKNPAFISKEWNGITKLTKK